MDVLDHERPSNIAVRLARQAIELAGDHATAASAVLTAAVSILAESIPPDHIALLIGEAVDEAAAAVRVARAH